MTRNVNARLFASFLATLTRKVRAAENSTPIMAPAADRAARAYADRHFIDGGYVVMLIEQREPVGMEELRQNLLVA